MNSFYRSCGRLNAGAGTIAGGIVIVMMAVILFDVTGRYLFNSPLLGSIELNRTLLIVIVFFGLGYTQLYKGHIRVDLVFLRTPVNVRSILEIFSLLIALMVYGFVAYTTIPVAYHAVVIGEYETGAIPFPMWPARLVLPIGLLILVLQLVTDTIEQVQQRR